MSDKPKFNVYEKVTQDVLAELEKGKLPWSKPWKANLLPTSASTGKPYSGVNRILLSLYDFASPFWLTYNQANKLNLQVRKGEKSVTVMFYKTVNGKDSNGDKTTFPLARAFRVFNLDQVDGDKPEKFIVSSDEPDKFKPDAKANDISNAYILGQGVEYTKGGDRAYYSPSEDRVNMPEMDKFYAADGWHRTLFHELAHSTGHKDRLSRDFNNTFGSEPYATEELIAELAAAMLCAATGISSEVTASAAYIKSWQKRLSADPKLIVQASSKAQKAADLILNPSI